MEEQYQKLIAPFPPEAMYKDTSRGKPLTIIKPQYVVERMNEVFGIEGWSTGAPEFSEDDTGVLCHLHVYIGDQHTTRHGVGYAQFGTNKLIGDVYKAAFTDALKKACSYFGVGNDIYKGLVTPPKTERKTRPTEEIPPVAGQAEQVAAPTEETTTRRRGRRPGSKNVTPSTVPQDDPSPLASDTNDVVIDKKVATPNKLISRVLARGKGQEDGSGEE